jgi:nucleotide-binding universal stress UspA family protein
MTRIGRILVAMDAAHQHEDALEMAAELAEFLHGELSGIFVEDTDLISAMALPFAREVSGFGGGDRAPDAERLQREYEAQAFVARRALEKAALRRRVKWSFRTARGRVQMEIGKAAEVGDILCLAARSRGGGALGGFDLGQLELAGRGRAVLVAGRAVPFAEGPVVVFTDDVASSRQAVEIGAGLAQRHHQLLRICAVGIDDAGAEAILAMVPAGDNGRKPDAEIVHCLDCDPLALARRAGAARAGLVISNMIQNRTAAWTRALMTEFACPLLVLNR